MEDNGKLVKVLIHAYSDEELKKKSNLKPNPISLPVNPESFTQNFKMELNFLKGLDQRIQMNYNGIKPEELRLDFVFDGTDLIQGYKYNSANKSVKAQLEIFLKTVYEMNKTVHKPRFLQVQWGKFLFPCILSNLDLNYTLFKPNGDPLRIKANATFINYNAQIERIAREGQQSPNLASMRLEKAEDGSDLITEKTFKNSAELIETRMEWDDLVLNEETKAQIQELQSWITHGDALLDDWGMRKKLKPGYRVLFHGLPGTGKTLTASLLGKYTGKDVYKIDLSILVSKYIDETEKNLSNLFAIAGQKKGILFFEGIDVLFEDPDNVNKANNEYANQEISYLLHRIENYEGLVILASNLKNKIGDAFLRHLQSIIHFPLPEFSERIEIWKKAFPEKVSLHEEVNLSQFAKKYELSGAEIMNVVQYSCLRALADKKKIIHSGYIVDGVKREFQKGRRIML